jgi:hypothetical protein
MGILDWFGVEWTKKPPSEIDEEKRKRQAEQQAQDAVQKAIENAQIEIIKQKTMGDWAEKD